MGKKKMKDLVNNHHDEIKEKLYMCTHAHIPTKNKTSARYYRMSRSLLGGV